MTGPVPSPGKTRISRPLAVSQSRAFPAMAVTSSEPSADRATPYTPAGPCSQRQRGRPGHGKRGGRFCRRSRLEQRRPGGLDRLNPQGQTRRHQEQDHAKGFCNCAHLMQELPIPAFRLAAPSRQGVRGPDHAHGSRGFWIGLGTLSVLHCVGAGAFRIHETKQPGQVDGLPRGVEHVRRSRRSDADAKRGLGPVEVDHADRQAAVKRHDIAHVDGGVDRGEGAIADGTQEIFRCRFAAAGRFEAAVPQELPHGIAHRVVALQRSRRLQRQQRENLRRRRHVAKRPWKRRGEGATSRRGWGSMIMG